MTVLRLLMVVLVVGGGVADACAATLPAGYLSGFPAVDVESRQVAVQSPVAPSVLSVPSRIHSAPTFDSPLAMDMPKLQMPSMPPFPTLVTLPPFPKLPSLADILKINLTVTTTTLPETKTPVLHLVDNELNEALSSPQPDGPPISSVTYSTPSDSQELLNNEVLPEQEDSDAASGNGTSPEEEHPTTLLASATSLPTETTAAATTKPADCTKATVTAITLMAFNDNMVANDIERIRQQIILLESYTQRKFDSFGEYTQAAINIDGQFALEYKISNVQNCSELRDYATKSVSYSREIERVLFTCRCEPMWIIAKRRSG